jgi:hypothetical protein
VDHVRLAGIQQADQPRHQTRVRQAMQRFMHKRDTRSSGGIRQLFGRRIRRGQGDQIDLYAATLQGTKLRQQVTLDAAQPGTFENMGYTHRKANLGFHRSVYLICIINKDLMPSLIVIKPQ